MKYTQYAFVILLIFSISKISFARGNIVDYYLNNPNAWEDTSKITHNTPTKVIIEERLEGLIFNLTELTKGDEVTLIFLETKKVEKMKRIGFCKTEGKLLPGLNRVVSVITRNYGNRTQFHYKFMLQKYVNDIPIETHNNGNAVLESKYDGSLPVKDISNLSGIKLCEIEIR